MKEIWSSPYRRYFLFGLACTLIASWFSMGFQQMDEHFMILEFSNYKFGLVPPSEIPWEFREKIRPCLQPTIAYYIFGLLKSMGIQNPFIHVFFVRMLSGVLAWLVSCKLSILLSKNLRHPAVQKWTQLAFTCFWFFAYLNVRFSSENLSGICLAAALLLLPDLLIGKKGESVKPLQWITAGLLLGLSFYFRFQVAFAILGILVWILFFGQSIIKSYSLLLLGAIIAIALNTYVDYWFYGEWVISPYRYFESNILHNVAATYGTTPWYDYFILFLSQGIPPISWILFILFFIGLYKQPKHILTFVVVCFLAGHILVAHKEFRFLFPIILPFLGICFMGLDAVWPWLTKRKWLQPSLKVLVLFNMALLAYRSFWPAKINHAYYKFLYHYTDKHPPVQLYTIGRGIFDEGYNMIRIYQHPNFQEDTLTEQAFETLLNKGEEDSLLVMSYQTKLPLHNKAYSEELMYVSIPKWVVNIELNDWQSRSDIWSLWMLRKKKQ